MALPPSRSEREHDKFVASASGPTAVKVTNPDGSSIGGSGGTSATDDAAFTPGSSSVTPAGFIVDETATDALDEGDVGAARLNPTTRILYVQLKDNAGVDVSVGGGTQYDEDTASVAAEKVTMAGVVRKDTAASLVGTDGDRTELQVDSSGQLRIAAIPAGLNYIGQVAAIELGSVVDDFTTFTGITDYTLSFGAGANAAAFELAATWVATIVFEGRTGASGTWSTITATRLSDGALVSSTTANGVFIFAQNGLREMRLRVSAYTSGTVDVHTSSYFDPTLTRLTAPIPAGTATIGQVKLTDGTDVADVLDLANSNPLTVAIVDTSGDQIASFGGGTQYTEDAAAAANPVGTALTLVRDDARGGSLTTTDGDNVAARGTNSGELYVKHTDAIPITDNSGSLTVDGTVAVSSITTAVVPGVGATNLGKAEDAAHSSGDVGVMALSVRQDTAAALAGTDTDYQPLITDSTGRLHVNVGNTVTVGSHAVTNAGTFAVQATVAAAASNIAKAEDVASADADVGVAAMAVRKATPANTSGTDGDYEMLQMSAGRLWVDPSGVTLTVGSHAVTNAGTFLVQENGTQVQVDDAAFTPATSKVSMVGAEFDDTSPDSVDEGDGGALRMSGRRELYTQIRDAAGNERGANVNASNQLAIAGPVTNAGTFAVQATEADGANVTLGAKADAKSTATDTTAVTIMSVLKQVSASVQAPPSQAVTNAGTFAVQDSEKIADNGGFTDGTTKVLPVGFIYDEVAGTALTENDIGTPRMNVNRSSVATIEDGVTRGRYATVSAANAVKVDGSAVTQPISGTVTASNTAGDIASDGVDSGNPVKIGMQARTSDPTAVASADRVNAIGTILGKQIVKLDTIPDLSWSYAAVAGGLVTTTGVTAKAAGGAGVRLYVKSAQVMNSHATVSTEVLIRDGAAGTVLHRGWAQAAGGGYAMTFDPPLRGTANTLIEIAEVTTTGTAGVLVDLQGYSAAE